MDYLYLVKNEEELARLKQQTENIPPLLEEYLIFLKENYQVYNPPRTVVWADCNSATHAVSELPLPAYTNDVRTVITPDIQVWKQLYLRQPECCGETGDAVWLRQYYNGLSQRNILQLLGHEMAHHSELFIDEAYETAMWFEEGMAEYISRKYFLTPQEYALQKQANELIVKLHEEKHGPFSLKDFNPSSYGKDIGYVFYCYWKSFLAVDSAAQKHGGNAAEVFAEFRRFYEGGAEESPKSWLNAN